MLDTRQKIDAHVDVASGGEDVVEEDAEVDRGQIRDWSTEAGGRRVFSWDRKEGGN